MASSSRFRIDDDDDDRSLARSLVRSFPRGRIASPLTHRHARRRVRDRRPCAEAGAHDAVDRGWASAVSVSTATRFSSVESRVDDDDDFRAMVVRARANS